MPSLLILLVGCAAGAHARAKLVCAALFLALPASDFVNGQVVYVDGGLLASL